MLPVPVILDKESLQRAYARLKTIKEQLEFLLDCKNIGYRSPSPPHFQRARSFPEGLLSLSARYAKELQAYEATRSEINALVGIKIVGPFKPSLIYTIRTLLDALSSGLGF